MKKYRMSVCKGPVCRQNGSDAVFACAKQQLAQAGAAVRCDLYRGGCYGLCHLGPNVVVREDVNRPKDPFSPEDFQLMGWDGEYHYQEMTPERMERVVAEHLTQDKPIPEFVPAPEDGFFFPPGKP